MAEVDTTTHALAGLTERQQRGLIEVRSAAGCGCLELP